MALPARMRLHINAQTLARLRKMGRAIHTPQLSAYTIKTDDIQSRFGVSISGHVAKKAVERNRLRRRIQSFLSHKGDQVKNSVMIIYPKKTMLTASHAEIEKILQHLLQRSTT